MVARDLTTIPLFYHWPKKKKKKSRPITLIWKIFRINFVRIYVGKNSTRKRGSKIVDGKLEFFQGHVYIIINFRVHEISWSTFNLIQITTLIKKKTLLIVEAFGWNFAHHGWTPVHMKIHRLSFLLLYNTNPGKNNKNGIKWGFKLVSSHTFRYWIVNDYCYYFHKRH